MKRTPRKSTASRTTARKAPARRANSLDSLRANAADALDLLMKQGAALQREGRRLATSTTRQARAAVLARAHEARTRTAGAVSRLEKVFEDRVGRAIARLGVPTARDVRALSRQVAELQHSVDRLRRSRG